MGRKYDEIYYVSIKLGIGKPISATSGGGPYLWTDTAVKELKDYFDALQRLKERQPKTFEQIIQEKTAKANADRQQAINEAINKIASEKKATRERGERQAQLANLTTEKQNARKINNFGDRQAALRAIADKEKTIS